MDLLLLSTGYSFNDSGITKCMYFDYMSCFPLFFEVVWLLMAPYPNNVAYLFVFWLTKKKIFILLFLSLVCMFKDTLLGTLMKLYIILMYMQFNHAHIVNTLSGEQWSSSAGFCWGSFHSGVICGWRWFIKALHKNKEISFLTAKGNFILILSSDLEITEVQQGRLWCRCKLRTSV